MRLRAWDGSRPGRPTRPLVVLNSPDAVRRLLWHPGELGAAQAYVTGELDVPGDLDAALTHAFAVGRSGGCPRRPPVPARCSAALRAARAIGALGRTAADAAVAGARRARDHYDLSNEFY